MPVELQNMLKKRSNNKTLLRLGVNIDHAATLRQVRGGKTSYPNLLVIASEVKAAGAHQITIHLREDRRHIQDQDVVRLCRQRVLPINLELAPHTSLLKQVLRSRPDWICFVPERRQELTTEGGLDVRSQLKKLRQLTSLCHAKGVLVSMFINADRDQVEASRDSGADAVEFHTGAWVEARSAEKKKEWRFLVESAQVAHALGLRVHAGHGLDLGHARRIVQLPHLVEVNIGHSLICEALRVGIRRAVSDMLSALGSEPLPDPQKKPSPKRRNA